MQETSLTADDVQKLISAPSDDARLETATKVCQVYTSAELTSSQRQIAEDVFKLLVSDQSKLVRESVANNLKDSEQLPHDLALKLASDLDDSVAFPMLQCSQVLNDQDLIEIIRTAAPDRQLAIADRENVSEGVSEELVEHGDQNVVVKLFKNESANIPDKSFETAQQRFAGADQFDNALVTRDRVPLTVRSKIIAALTDQVLGVLSGAVDASPSIIADIVIQAHDNLVIQLSNKSTEASIDEFVDNLEKSGHLTTSILIRALCQGDILFFEVAMAKLANIPVKNASKLLHDKGREGFKALYKQTGLDDSYEVFFEVASRMCTELLESGEDYERTEFRRKLIERFLTEEPEIIDKLAKNDMEYLIGKI